MAEAISELTRILEQLNDRIESLENRVSALEGSSAKQAAVRTIPEAPAARPSRPPETWQAFPPIEMPAMVSTLGRSVVGLAGAYLLRATAESGTLSRVVVVIGVLYAALWMVWAVRANRDRFVSVSYGITSLLILSPMLWESTVVFQFVSPAFSGAILVLFFVFVIALSWKRELLAIPWLVAVACTVTALSLIVATHDLVPLTTAILAIALSVEVAGCSGRLMSVRAIAAVAADVAVLLLVDLLSSGFPEGYRPASATIIIAIWFTLMAIYVGSIGIRCFWLKRPITIVDIGQGTLCLVIAGFGAVRSSQISVLMAFGIGLLAMAMACYWGALATFSGPACARNRRVSAIWAPVLLIAASCFLFSGDLRVLALCIASLSTTLGYTRRGDVGLGIHASVFLAAGAASSPLPDYVMNALAGIVPAAPGWSSLVTATTAALCYSLGSHTRNRKTDRRILWVFPAALLAFSGVAMAVAGITWFAAGRIDVSASRLSVIRTIVNCAAALSLAFVAVRWRRVELGWVAYAAVAFGTLKLLFEDLRYGSPASLVLSFLFYGLVLIVLPRLIRQGPAEYVASKANSVSKSFTAAR